MFGGFIERPLPGEWEGTLDPRDYGFEVIRDESQPTLQELATFWRQARAYGGIGHPVLDRWLEHEEYDSEPSALLLEKHRRAAADAQRTEEPEPLLVDLEGEVFDPYLSRVSTFLLDNVNFKKARRGRVLDAFCGSAFFGIRAAYAGAEVVTSYDNSDAAVTYAAKNIVQAEVDDVIDIRKGTIGEGVISEGEKFDLIIANPPLLPFEPKGEWKLESALFDPGLSATLEFIDALPELLAKHGVCYLASSDVIDRKASKVDIRQHCLDNNLTFDTVAQLHRSYESYRTHRIEHSRFASRMRPRLKKLGTYLLEH
jgi:methylase of polypeptide subunit release factors